MNTIFNDPLITATGLTLLHSLWQVGLLALLLRLSWLLIGPRRVQARYWSGLIAMVGLLGWTTYTWLNAWREAILTAYATPAEYTGQALPATFATTPSNTFWSFNDWYNALSPFLPWLVLAWCAGLLCLSLRLAWEGRQLYRLRRSAQASLPATWQVRFTELVDRTGIRRAVQWRESDRARSPLTLGHFRPIILFPIGLVNQLSPAEVEAILLHELAHIQRYDYLVNWVQTLVETIFFYHPAVWWMSAEIRRAREYCCDDLALRWNQGDRMTYAQTLLQLTRLQINHYNLTLAMKTKNGDLTQRVQRLFGHRPRQRVLPTLLLFGGFLSLLLFTSTDLYRAVSPLEETIISPENPGVTQADTLPDKVKEIVVKEEVPVHGLEAELVELGTPLPSLQALVAGEKVELVELLDSLPKIYLRPTEVIGFKTTLDLQNTDLQPVIVEGTKVTLDGQLSPVTMEGIRLVPATLSADKVVAVHGVKINNANVNNNFNVNTDVNVNTNANFVTKVDATVDVSVHPLCFVDGVEVTFNGSINIDPNDIQSVEVMKGEQAIGRYGERGANGVILVTTKAKPLPEGQPKASPKPMPLPDKVPAQSAERPKPSPALMDVPGARLPAWAGSVQLFPNPTDQTATLKFSLPKEAFTTISLHNVEGKLLRRVGATQLSAGPHQYDISLTNLAAGTYLVTIQAGDEVHTQQLQRR